MPSYSLEYPKEPFSTVKRLSNRADYALETIHGIINSCQILHVSYNVPDSPFPVIIPMLGQMGSFARPSADLGDVLELYLHGYVSTRMANASRKDSPEGGLPVCVAASHLDGLVLALTPFHHSCNYRSAVVFGRATVVEDPAEKVWATQLITDGVLAGRWDNSRVPPTRAEMASTAVLRVTIASGSAKVRTGGPGDDREDEEDAALVGRTWTGVVPVYQTLGEPVASGYNKVERVPKYMADYIRDTNEESKSYAVEAVHKVMVKKKTDD
ncbi:Flavin-nucleotide-binding protein [Pleurostoma richardsiae]|uniref:Flavin-nucleotide-binding protein n=1 Tax=Pleurostoma richardsiae TaxID=41990 RepID=A0AA38VUE5_9PEZI|nr:Flavin-nucleotide-binding protein [Pleurostoma richardsiae]